MKTAKRILALLLACLIGLSAFAVGAGATTWNDIMPADAPYSFDTITMPLNWLWPVTSQVAAREHQIAPAYLLNPGTYNAYIAAARPVSNAIFSYIERGSYLPLSQVETDTNALINQAERVISTYYGPDIARGTMLIGNISSTGGAPNEIHVLTSVNQISTWAMAIHQTLEPMLQLCHYEDPSVTSIFNAVNGQLNNTLNIYGILSVGNAALLARADELPTAQSDAMRAYAKGIFEQQDTWQYFRPALETRYGTTATTRILTKAQAVLDLMRYYTRAEFLDSYNNIVREVGIFSPANYAAFKADFAAIDINAFYTTFNILAPNASTDQIVLLCHAYEEQVRKALAHLGSLEATVDTTATVPQNNLFVSYPNTSPLAGKSFSATIGGTNNDTSVPDIFQSWDIEFTPPTPNLYPLADPVLVYAEIPGEYLTARYRMEAYYIGSPPAQLPAVPILLNGVWYLVFQAQHFSKYGIAAGPVADDATYEECLAARDAYLALGDSLPAGLYDEPYYRSIIDSIQGEFITHIYAQYAEGNALEQQYPVWEPGWTRDSDLKRDSDIPPSDLKHDESLAAYGAWKAFYDRQTAEIARIAAPLFEVAEFIRPALEAKQTYTSLLAETNALQTELSKVHDGLYRIEVNEYIAALIEVLEAQYDIEATLSAALAALPNEPEAKYAAQATAYNAALAQLSEKKAALSAIKTEAAEKIPVLEAQYNDVCDLANELLEVAQFDYSSMSVSATFPQYEAYQLYVQLPWHRDNRLYGLTDAALAALFNNARTGSGSFDDLATNAQNALSQSKAELQTILDNLKTELANSNNDDNDNDNDNNKEVNPPTTKTIFSTKYPSTPLNWFLFIVCFGWIWMWF